MTESQSLAALRTALMGYCPGIEAVQGQVNRVPTVTGPDYIVFVPVRRVRLGTNHEAVTSPTTVTLTAPTQMDVMVYVYGPANADNAQAIRTLWRSPYNNMPGALFGTDPVQVPFVNAEQQYEPQWVMTLSMQIDAPIVTTVQTADMLALGLVDVDAVFPPEPTP